MTSMFVNRYLRYTLTRLSFIYWGRSGKEITVITSGNVGSLVEREGGRVGTLLHTASSLHLARQACLE